MTNQNHRRANTVGVVTIIALLLGYIVFNQHTMHDCEERLFEKLTNQKAPKGIR